MRFCYFKTQQAETPSPLTMEKIVIDNRMNQIYQETSARNKN